jgi:hypothetical protein
LSAPSLSQIDSKMFCVLERQKGFPSFIIHVIILCQLKIFGLEEVMNCSLVSLMKYNNVLLM